MSDLEVRNLHVEIEGEEILRGLDLDVDKGRIHALMLSLIHISEPTRPY